MHVHIHNIYKHLQTDAYTWKDENVFPIMHSWCLPLHKHYAEAHILLFLLIATHNTGAHTYSTWSQSYEAVS